MSSWRKRGIKMVANVLTCSAGPEWIWNADALLRGRHCILGLCALALCLTFAGCDPAYMQVDRFESDSRHLLSQSELNRMDEAALAEGFSIAESPRDPIEWREQDCLRLLARYESALRKPDWGTCNVSVLLRMPSGAVELELYAFPARSHPEHMKALHSALSSLLAQFGYGMQ